MNYAQYEQETNSLLCAVQKGGHLYDALCRCRPFDAVLVPIQAALDAMMEQLGTSTHQEFLTEAFLKAHIIRLDHRYGQSFVTLGDVKGRFGDQLESLQLHGRPTVTVLRHVVPDATVPQSAIDENAPNTLNFFLISDILYSKSGGLSSRSSVLGLSEVPESPTTANSFIPFGVVQSDPQRSKSNSPIPQGTVATKHTDPSATSDGDGERSSWGSWLLSFGKTATSKVVGTVADVTAARNAGIASPTPASSRTAIKESKFREFQEKMAKPASQSLVKGIKTFILEVESDPKFKNKDSPGVTPSIVHDFIDECVDHMSEIALWSSEGKAGLETARDCLEKYIMTKIFSLCFCRTEEEAEANTTLERRMTALQAAIKPEQLDTVDVRKTPEYPRAVEMLRKMNTYRNPIDKIDCIAKCFDKLLIALQQVSQEAKAAEAAAKAKSQPSDASAANSSSPEHKKEEFGADQLLPCFMFTVLQANPPSLISNAKFIEAYRHPLRMQSESGYYATTLLSVAMYWLKCTAADLKMTQQEFNDCLKSDRRGERITGPASPIAEVVATPQLAVPRPTPPPEGAGSSAQVSPEKGQSASVFDEIFGVLQEGPKANGADSATSVVVVKTTAENDDDDRRKQITALNQVTDARDLQLGQVQLLLDEYHRLRAELHRSPHQ